jgi:hypothetical protein
LLSDELKKKKKKKRKRRKEKEEIQAIMNCMMTGRLVETAHQMPSRP